ncbi:MAG: MBL fold metallo-hydrolase, partial [Nostoc sp.]
MRNNLSASSRVDAAEASSELECLPYSVQHDNEGVCLLVKMGPHRILLDCGLEDISSLAKGLTKSEPGISSPLPADLVLISHAHP